MYFYPYNIVRPTTAVIRNETKPGKCESALLPVLEPGFEPDPRSVGSVIGILRVLTYAQSGLVHKHLQVAGSHHKLLQSDGTGHFGASGTGFDNEG